MKIRIKKVREGAVLPAYQTVHSAGMDLHAAIDGPITLQPGERAAIPTGVAVAVPSGYEAQLRGRSGLAAKHGIALSNGVGTIDADYRGEVQVLITNFGQDTFVVEPDMRIAQMVVARFETVQWDEADELDETERGENGFGSTGK